MKKYDVLIIGGGLGGLQCAHILSKNGMKVCVLEKNSTAGGCLQTFGRGKYTFDTGFHYVGGLDEGQPLNRMFKYFGLMDLPWQRMDENGFDEIIINDKSFLYANGFEKFADKMTACFPRQEANIRQYTELLQNVSLHLFDFFIQKNDYTGKLLSTSAYNYLESLTGDNLLLLNALSGASFKMDLNRKTLPLYLFAQINSSYIQSAWRLKGGGSLIIKKLIQNIENNGGEVITNAEIVELKESEGKIIAAETTGGERFEADYFISDIHPQNTLRLISESKKIKSIYRKRIDNMTNTNGVFTVHLTLKENSVPYLNRNLYIYEGCNVWDNCDESLSKLMVSFQVPEYQSLYTNNIDILTPAVWNEFNKWENTKVGRRGSDYEEFKKEKARKCIEIVSKHIKGLEGFIENIYTSSPLTWRDYTGTPNGSAYGFRKDFDNTLTSFLSLNTPVPNLLLTGQNINIHGVLGVSITSLMTCSQIIGKDTIFANI
jgi:phytoene dehydrogenase-like protein